MADKTINSPAASSAPAPATPHKTHDHSFCREQALQEAERLCQRRSVKLTPLRQKILALVWDSHKPVGGYQLIEKLQLERDTVAPPTVYRALDFLLAQGLIHRITSQNAFVGCSFPNWRHRGGFLICRKCEDAIEFKGERFFNGLLQDAVAKSFTVEEVTLEVRGLCQNCRYST